MDGLALFAATTFAVGLAAILALDRVGAPDGLVRAAGPILILIGCVAFGLGARASGLSTFMAAGRSVRPLYGGLAFAAVAAGMAFAFESGGSAPSDPLGVIVGFMLSAIVCGPLLRRFGATSIADIVATRFPSGPARAVSGLVLAAAAILTAFAGYQIAIAAVRTLLVSNLLWAETLTAAALALSVVPGGLSSALWSAAASGGALGMMLILGFAAGWQTGGAPSDPGSMLREAMALGRPAALAATVSTSLAIAGFFALAAPAIASPSPLSALKGGLIAIVFCAAFASLGGAAALPAGLASRTDPVAASLTGATVLAASLSLARAGVHSASRAFGVALAAPPRPFPTLANVRLARMRLAQVLIVIACAVCDSERVVDPRTALVIAMGLSLALTTPMAALAAIARVGPLAAGLAVLAGLATAGFRLRDMPLPLNATSVFLNALPVAAAVFVAGCVASFVLPRRGAPPTPGAFDPYADPSL